MGDIGVTSFQQGGNERWNSFSTLVGRVSRDGTMTMVIFAVP